MRYLNSHYGQMETTHMRRFFWKLLRFIPVTPVRKKLLSEEHVPPTAAQSVSPLASLYWPHPLLPAEDHGSLSQAGLEIGNYEDLLFDCPWCKLPAEVTGKYVIMSPNMCVEYVKLTCILGHDYIPNEEISSPPT